MYCRTLPQTYSLNWSLVSLQDLATGDMQMVVDILLLFSKRAVQCNSYTNTDGSVGADYSIILIFI